MKKLLAAIVVGMFALAVTSSVIAQDQKKDQQKAKADTAKKAPAKSTEKKAPAKSTEKKAPAKSTEKKTKADTKKKPEAKK